MQWHRREQLSKKKRIEAARKRKNAHTWGGPIETRPMTEDEWNHRKDPK